MLPLWEEPGRVVRRGMQHVSEGINVPQNVKNTVINIAIALVILIFLLIAFHPLFIIGMTVVLVALGSAGFYAWKRIG